MILGTKEIERRLGAGDIFREDTFSKSSIKEASYALRVAETGMVVDGEVFSPDGEPYSNPTIEIKPGRIAILSTKERLCMSGDLVGRLGVRLDFASRGLTGLMGIQVDPYYGMDHPTRNERLFIKVANFGNETVKIKPGDAVLNIEFSEVNGATKPDPPKRPTWDRLLEELVNQEHSDWTFVARVQTDLDKRADDLETQMSKDLTETRTQQQRELSGIRDNQQSVVLFGVFLVAITILAVAIGAILNVKDSPSWVTDGGWILLMALCIIATTAILAFVGVAGWGYLMSTRGYYKKYVALNAPAGITPTKTGEE